MDNGQSHWSQNPGQLANRYHRDFSKVVGFNSLEQLDALLNDPKVSIKDHYHGFHQRNLIVGQVDYLMAFTFSQGEPSDGGTGHTWKNSSCPNKISLNIDN